MVKLIVICGDTQSMVLPVFVLSQPTLEMGHSEYIDLLKDGPVSYPQDYTRYLRFLFIMERLIYYGILSG